MDKKQVYEQILDLLPDPIFAINKERKIIFWNKAIEKQTGLKREEVLGENSEIYSICFYGEKRPLLVDLVLESDSEIEKNTKNLKGMQMEVYKEKHIVRI